MAPAGPYTSACQIGADRSKGEIISRMDSDPQANDNDNNNKREVRVAVVRAQLWSRPNWFPLGPSSSMSRGE